MKCITCGAESVEIKKCDIPGMEYIPVVGCPNNCEEQTGYENMSHWNYRILKHKDKTGTWFGLHEVYYNKDGSINSYTQDEIVYGDTAQEVLSVLRQMLHDAETHSVREAPYDEDTDESKEANNPSKD
jgi:hypothetical protein